ncbi:MAG: rhomboid family intramembrane serine protease [Verrucomicrobiota bacterium]
MNDTDQTNTTDEWVQVGHFSSLEQAYDHGLVILAMGEACRVEEAAVPGEFDLQAEAVPAAKISAELDAYGKEIALPVRQPEAGREWARHPAGWSFVGVWVLVLMAVSYWQGRDASLVERAASSSVGIFGRSEWWRPFTALFLHADLPHLMGNLVGGTIFATLVSKAIGPLRAWAMILICGTLGNLLTAQINYPDAFLSIGASTAVFAALGILSGLGISETVRERARLPWARITAPVLAGIVLLSWLGSGNGTNTDVMGHVFGFSSGLVAGMATGAFEDKGVVVAS